MPFVFNIFEGEFLHGLDVIDDRLEQFFTLRMDLGVFGRSPTGFREEDLDLLLHFGDVDLFVDRHFDDGLAGGAVVVAVSVNLSLVGRVGERCGGEEDGKCQDGILFHGYQV